MTAEAAQTTSPSFSRLSSSMTTTNSPCLIASIASGTGSNWKGVGGVVGGLDTWEGRDMVAEKKDLTFQRTLLAKYIKVE